MKKYFFISSLMYFLCGLSLISSATAQHNHAHAQGAVNVDVKAQCTDPSLRCAKAAMPYFSDDGSLWVVWSAAGAISVARSSDLGKHFDDRIEIARHDAFLDTGPDARPQIVGDRQGNMTIAYSFFRDKNWNAQINISTSSNKGRSFTAPRSISTDPTSQRFPALGVNQQGRLFAVWIDKRDVAAATAAGVKRSGASIAFAWSEDGGQTFQDERLVRDQSCECCRIGLALTGQGMPAILYRAIFEGGVRDHASQMFMEPQAEGPVRRVALDDWKTDSCPHHGPSLAVSAHDTLHAAWFTQGDERAGLFYARSTDAGEHYSKPREIGNPDRQPGRPYLYAHGHQVWLVWKEFDGKKVTVWEQRSNDDGASWNTPAQVAEAVGYTDHPILISNGSRVFLSWFTAANGYRLMELSR